MGSTNPTPKGSEAQPATPSDLEKEISTAIKFLESE